MSFQDYNLSKQTMKGILSMGFSEPTPIQSQAIPPCLEGHDMIAQSQTGTGKTAAFAIPMLENIDTESNKLQALVLCPTRELAVQVSEAISELAIGYKSLKVIPVYGGENISIQLRNLKKGAQIVVGTPGRTKDHFDRGSLKADELKILTLDEADEMLKMGFKDELEAILSFLPEERQTMLFSATIPHTVSSLAKKYTKEPKKIRIARENSTNKDIEQSYYLIKRRHKVDALLRLIDYQNPKQALIFCNTKRGVDILSEAFQKKDVVSDKIHGDILQAQRLDTIKRFNDGHLNLLIATDVAARGLDIDGVDAVYNFDVPTHPENYVHRIGRTGRAGRQGIASTIASREDVKFLTEIMHYTKEKINEAKLPTLRDVNKARIDRYIVDTVKAKAEFTSTHAQYIIDSLEQEGLSAHQIAASVIDMTLSLETGSDYDLSFKTNVPTSRRNQKSSSSYGKSNPKRSDSLRINLGHSDNISVRDLLYLISSKANVRKHDIGNIRLREFASFLDMNESTANKIISALNGKSYNGKNMTLRYERASDRKSYDRKKSSYNHKKFSRKKS